MITGVHLITGLIGSGKTLRAVNLIKKEIADGRAVYACNINGLNIPGVIPFDDPNAWQDLPPKSLLVIDEAQRFWRARRIAEVPAALQAMETSRHDAVSFLVLTQQPTYLDKHLRGLVTKHEHLYRRMGLNSAQMFSWERCVDDPQSTTEKEGADQSIFIYPKQDFGSYDSAQEHTVKRNIGLRGKLIIGAFLVVAGIAFWVYNSISTDPKPATVKATSDGAAAQPQTVGRDLTPMTTEEYAARFNPRIATAPWTAPIYDQKNRASAEPRLYCISSADGLDANEKWKKGSFTCMTEQGTPYGLDEKSARMLARTGEVYNPFKRPTPQRQDTGVRPQAGRGEAPAPNALPASISLEAEQVGTYGDITAGT